MAVVFTYKTTDQTLSSVTPTNVTDLGVTIGSNQLIRFRFAVRYGSGPSTLFFPPHTLQLKLTVPSGCTGIVNTTWGDTTSRSVDGIHKTIPIYRTLQSMSPISFGGTPEGMVIVEGWAQTSGTSGTLQLQAAHGEATTLADVTIAANSYVTSYVYTSTNLSKSSSNQNFLNTTLTNISGVSFPVSANKTYYFYSVLPVLSGTSSGDGNLRLDVTVPSGAVGRVTIQGNDDDASDASQGSSQSLASFTFTRWAVASTTPRVIISEGWIRTSSTAGTVQFRGAQSNPDVDATTVRSGAWVEFKEVDEHPTDTANPVSIRIKGSSQSWTANTAFSDVADLVTVIPQNNVRLFRIVGLNSGSTNGNLKTILDTDAETSGITLFNGPSVTHDSSGRNLLGSRIFPQSDYQSFGNSGVSVSSPYEFFLYEGWATAVGGTGEVKLRAAQNTSNASASTIASSSWILWEDAVVPDPPDPPEPEPEPETGEPIPIPVTTSLWRLHRFDLKPRTEQRS